VNYFFMQVDNGSHVGQLDLS